ncbi:hypothetical protein HDV05_003477 [Chytridiales sp. JEL 0842]|nr:hypothetical protein HDV05_003477 [Chytridiales sp. JEL 0842]
MAESNAIQSNAGAATAMSPAKNLTESASPLPPTFKTTDSNDTHSTNLHSFSYMSGSLEDAALHYSRLLDTRVPPAATSDWRLEELRNLQRQLPLSELDPHVQKVKALNAKQRHLTNAIFNLLKSSKTAKSLLPKKLEWKLTLDTSPESIPAILSIVDNFFIGNIGSLKSQYDSVFVKTDILPITQPPILAADGVIVEPIWKLLPSVDSKLGPTAADYLRAQNLLYLNRIYQLLQQPSADLIFDKVELYTQDFLLARAYELNSLDAGKIRSFESKGKQPADAEQSSNGKRIIDARTEGDTVPFLAIDDDDNVEKDDVVTEDEKMEAVVDNSPRLVTDLPTASKKLSIAQSLPHEILSLIMSYSSYHFTLYAASLTCRSWSSVATPLLWENVMLASPLQLAIFIRSLLYNAGRFNPYLQPLVFAVSFNQDPYKAYEVVVERFRRRMHFDGDDFMDHDGGQQDDQEMPPAHPLPPDGIMLGAWNPHDVIPILFPASTLGNALFAQGSGPAAAHGQPSQPPNANTLPTSHISQSLIGQITSSSAGGLTQAMHIFANHQLNSDVPALIHQPQTSPAAHAPQDPAADTSSSSLSSSTSSSATSANASPLSAEIAQSAVVDPSTVANVSQVIGSAQSTFLASQEYFTGALHATAVPMVMGPLMQGTPQNDAETEMTDAHDATTELIDGNNPGESSHTHQSPVPPQALASEDVAFALANMMSTTSGGEEFDGDWKESLPKIFPYLTRFQLEVDLLELVQSNCWKDGVVTGYLGSHVKKLSIPTMNPEVNLAPVLNYLLPNLQCLHFQHSPIESMEAYHKLIPLEFGHVVTFSTLFQMLTSLSIEDVNEECWPQLCKLLQFTGGNIRALNLEAIGVMDAFDSLVSMETVFPGLPNLEFLRLDGLPIGNVSSITKLASSCKFLKAVTIDYCISISMSVFEVLWNSCEMLSFLGLAGIVNDVDPIVLLEERPKMKTLRLVDCDVSDDFFEEVARRASGLEMLRIVFEDDECDGIVAVWNHLTDRTLMAFAKGQPPSASNDLLHQTFGGSGALPSSGFKGSLKTLALTWCKNYSAEALKCVLSSNPIEVLDLHKESESTLGDLSDELLMEMDGYLKNIRTLHLFGQTTLSEQVIRQSLSSSEHTRSLRSVCFNNTSVSIDTLKSISSANPNLQSISVIQCDNITVREIIDFLKPDGGAPSKLLRLYSDNPEFFESEEQHRQPQEKDNENQTTSSSDDFPMSNADGYSALDVNGGAKDSLATPNPSPSRLQLTDEEKELLMRRVVLEDRWFVDESLDILSLWDSSIRQNCGPGKFYV